MQIYFARQRGPFGKQRETEGLGSKLETVPPIQGQLGGMPFGTHLTVLYWDPAVPIVLKV